MPLNAKLATRMAHRLTTIEDFPRFDEAIAETAHDLVELWSTTPDRLAEQQAEELVRHMRHKWPKWEGTAAMIELYRKKFAPELPASNEAKPLGERPAIDCSFCQDTGVVRAQDNPQAVAWCICPTAERVKRDWPEFLSLSAGKTFSAAKLPYLPPVDPVALDKIRKQMEQTEPTQVDRCEFCNGVGYKIGSNEFCSCPMGRDLARVEGRGPVQ